MYSESKQLEPQLSAVDIDTVDLRRTQDRLTQMVRRETTGFGDNRNALERICGDYELPFWTANRVMRGEAKTVTGGFIRRVRHAYLDYCERQIKKLQCELDTHKAISPDDDLEDLASETARLFAELQARRGALRTEEG